MALVESASYSHHNSTTLHGTREPSWLNAVLSRSSSCVDSDEKHTHVDYLDFAADLDGTRATDVETGSLEAEFDALDVDCEDIHSDLDTENHGIGLILPPFATNSVSEPTGPFKKWIKSIHRRAAQRPSVLRRHQHTSGHEVDPDECDSSGLSRHSHRRRASSSGSSFGFVAAVRSASASLASVSSVARSRRVIGRQSRGFSRTDRSSRASMSAARMSEDSAVTDRTTRMDCAAKERSLQRRRVLEEIITTEEGYIGDVRFLINVSYSKQRQSALC